MPSLLDRALPARIAHRRRPADPAPVTEAAPSPQPVMIPNRSGFVQGVPPSGFGEQEAASWSAEAQNTDRSTFLKDLWEEYLRCPWAGACVNAIARTVTAGGLIMRWDADTGEGNQKIPPKPPNVVAFERLISFTNAKQDIRQLMRAVVMDLMVFGDAFIEVVWLLGWPVALFNLDCPTTTPITDQHGNVEKYVQVTEHGQRAEFKPEQVIHISLDSARPAVFGISPTHMAEEAIVLWMYFAACAKKMAKRGLPPTIHADHPAGMAETDVKKWQDQYAVRNIGPDNIGVPITTKGGGKVAELQQQKIESILAAMKSARDTVVSTYGVPPAKVGVIESGNLGGGTGADQNKTYFIDVINPTAMLIAEKLQFALAVKAFHIEGWHVEFGAVDYRDDQTIENIRDMRIRNAVWCADAATEILTTDGWKTYDALKPGDTVLTLNHETGNAEWQQCQDVAVFPAMPREMIRMRSRAHSSLTMPDHRWPVTYRKSHGAGRRGHGRRWATTETLLTEDRIQTAAHSATLPIEAVYDDAFVELVAWFWTEGSTPGKANHNYVYITQKNLDGVERIRHALEKFFGPPYERSRYHRKCDPGVWIEQVRPNGLRHFRIAASHGHLFREVVDDHLVSMEFLLALTQEQLDLFIDVSMMADGHTRAVTGQQVLSQRRQEAVNRFQAACVLAGRASTVQEFRKSDRPHYRMWSINVSKRDAVKPVQAAREGTGLVERVIHDGPVWCPVTPNQTWLARRDGTVYFTGNTVNRARADVGEPAVRGGDVPVIIARQDIVAVADLADRSRAGIEALGAPALTGVPGKPGPAPATGTAGTSRMGGNSGAAQPVSAETAAAVEAALAEMFGDEDGLSEHSAKLTAEDKVWNRLSRDYPAAALEWVRDAEWTEPAHVPADQVDTEGLEAHDGPEVGRIRRRLRATGMAKPAILVRPVGSDRDTVIAGHRHVLAAVLEGRPVRAYVGHVASSTGPWQDLATRSHHKGGAGLAGHNGHVR